MGRRPSSTLAGRNKAFTTIEVKVLLVNPVRFARILNKVAQALGTIRFSQLLLLLLLSHLIHGARKQQASDRDTVKKLHSMAGLRHKIPTVATNSAQEILNG